MTAGLVEHAREQKVTYAIDKQVKNYQARKAKIPTHLFNKDHSTTVNALDLSRRINLGVCMLKRSENAALQPSEVQDPVEQHAPELTRGCMLCSPLRPDVSQVLGRTQWPCCRQEVERTGARPITVASPGGNHLNIRGSVGCNCRPFKLSRESPTDARRRALCFGPEKSYAAFHLQETVPESSFPEARPVAKYFGLPMNRLTLDLNAKNRVSTSRDHVLQRDRWTRPAGQKGVW